MKIGFSGTRKGMTTYQLDTFSTLFRRLEASEFHHGDCIGADDEAASDVVSCTDVRIFSHPPNNNKNRAFHQDWHHQYPVLPYLARNRAIVDATDQLIACPCVHVSLLSQGAGGTFYTINYAIERGKLVTVIWPDGHVTRYSKNAPCI